MLLILVLGRKGFQGAMCFENVHTSHFWLKQKKYAKA